MNNLGVRVDVRWFVRGTVSGAVDDPALEDFLQERVLNEQR